jgi:hypothetical protein
MCERVDRGKVEYTRRAGARRGNTYRSTGRIHGRSGGRRRSLRLALAWASLALASLASLTRSGSGTTKGSTIRRALALAHGTQFTLGHDVGHSHVGIGGLGDSSIVGSERVGDNTDDHNEGEEVGNAGKNGAGVEVHDYVCVFFSAKVKVMRKVVEWTDVVFTGTTKPQENSSLSDNSFD